LRGDPGEENNNPYRIHSATGALVASGSLNSPQQVIPVSGLASGLYQLLVDGPFGPEALPFVKE
jgi:hypothetical protein